MSFILGISALYHDSAAALVKDGVVVAAASEERFSRVKQDASLPLRAARWCLEQAGISVEDLEHVVYYEKPLWKFERLLVNQLLTFPKSRQAFQRTAMTWLTDKLWVKARLTRELGLRRDQLLFSDHHLSHAASAFYGSDFSEAAILTVDGVGEWATATMFRGGPKGIERLGEIRFPDSIGLVYSAFTAYLGFKVNEGEYKVMGMAAFGQPRFEAEVRKVLRLHDDGSFDVNRRYISYHYSATDSYTAHLVDLLGPPREPGSPFEPSSEQGQRYADVAASLQKVTEDALVGLATNLYARTGLDRLCMAGGVALNCVANRQILERSPFSQMWVHPAAGDAGGAVGAALWAWNDVLGRPRGPALTRPGLGQAWTHDQVGALLKDLHIPHEELDEDQLINRCVDDIAADRVVGWSQGGFEWGPRSLGHRSILADPRAPGVHHRVNASIKFRESFRPFAPSVLAGAEGRYFDMLPGGEQPSAWMLMVHPVKEDARSIIPAVTHVDGTARVHVVDEDQNPRYHKLLTAHGDASGHPILLNTSFNLKGEPIVSSPIHALATFERCDLDVLYVEGFRIEEKSARGGAIQ